MKPTERPAPVDLGTGALISRLLVPVSTETRHRDRGLDIAARLAEGWGLPIHLISVVDGDAEIIDLTVGENLAVVVERAAAAHPGVTISHETIVHSSDPVSGLAAQLTQTDLVVMTSSGAGADHNSMSFAEALGYEWAGPIMMVGPEVAVDAPLDGDVVVALDRSVFAARGLRAAAGLANALGSSLRLVRVRPASPRPQSDRGLNRSGLRSEAAYVLDLTEQQGFPSVAWEVLTTDDAVTTLTEFARRNDVAVLALVTTGMFTLTGPEFETACASLVQTSTRPVLASQPTTFDPDLILAGW